ncbi:hypothetical protein TrST_g8947 [Triparma strigata]|uniref:Globin domain-containing protein n=1 Tax=Triparma strigata TaxID=1606541 RepID=A0A9W7F0P8_9STRA|nr:hypothetical protein TrST_g8947 [Triparma strigata]
MSSTQKKLVQSTWSHLTTSFTFEIIGTLLFKSLFKTTPSAVSIFPFSREYMEAGSDVNSRLYTSPRFLEHAAKVIGAVDLAVKSLDDLETLAPILEDLGKKHVRYGVVTGHYDLVGNALIDTLKEALGEQWTEDVKGAWLVVWGLVRQTMDPDVFSVGQRVKTQFGKGVVAEKRDNDYVVVPHTSTWVLAYGQKPILNLAPNMLKPDDA